MRSKINRWLFFLGLILSFAGLNVTLLLSHLRETNPEIGPLLLLLGILAIISANPDWRQNLWKRFPSSLQRLSRWLEMPRFLHLQILIFATSLISVMLILFDEIFSLLLLTVFLVSTQTIIAVLIRWQKEDKTKIWLVLQVQLFFVFSFVFVYHYLDALVGWTRLSSDLKHSLFLLLWLTELSYLMPRVYNIFRTGKSSEKPPPSEEETPLSLRFIYKLTLNGRLKSYLPVFGLLLIISTIAFNIYTSSGLDIGSHDGISYLFGVVLILYNYIPEDYGLERDFAALFLFSLFLILVVPITIYTYLYGGLEESMNSPFIYYLLAEPTTYILNAGGIRATAAMNAGASGEWVVIRSLVMSTDGRKLSTVGVGLSCTGLYSVSIFISGYLGFLLTNYSQLNLKTGLFMGIGIFTAWLANVLRMTVIMLAGYYYGMDALLWTHHYAGIFIFIAWISLFWGVLFHFVDISLILNYPTDYR